MDILTFTQPPLATNAFLCLPENGGAILIDAPAETAEAIASTLAERGRTLTAVLLTHGHFDHILGVSAFNDQNVPVYAHPSDRELFSNISAQMALFGMGSDSRPASVDHWLEPGTDLELAGEVIAVRPVPGHCPGNVLFVFHRHGVAFPGDAIFNGSIGRCDLPGGDFDRLARSIREEIYTLPDATTLYPGHGPATTVAAEKAGNAYVRPL